MSLRTKLTLALLLMSFVALGVVGVTARSVMRSRFDEFVVDRAVEGFIREVVTYHRAFGSWDAATASGESFFEFIRRTGVAPDLIAGRGPGPGRRGPRGGPGQGGPPPRPGSGEPPLRPGQGGPPPAGPSGSEAMLRRFPLGGGPPPFVVTDRAGRVLLPLADLRVGDRVDDDRLALARPIVDGSRELGLAVPLERPEMTDMEARYLSSMQTSWLWALLLASALAVPLGLFLGDRLTRPLREITAALDAMREGRLKQTVRVRSRDEVGRLGVSFNAMSRELSTAYDELEDSRGKLAAHARELADLSRRDSLTGLLNRRGFAERMEGLVSRVRRHGHDLCVAMVDVDDFKGINDAYSHATGDDVLVQVAGILRRALRDSDVVGRYGGEEFVVAFDETSLGSAEVLSERLRKAFESFDWSGVVPGRSVTVSVGLAALGAGEELDAALERADRRLYRAKERGRNRVEA